LGGEGVRKRNVGQGKGGLRYAKERGKKKEKGDVGEAPTAMTAKGRPSVSKKKKGCACEKGR